MDCKAVAFYKNITVSHLVFLSISILCLSAVLKYFPVDLIAEPKSIALSYSDVNDLHEGKSAWVREFTFDSYLTPVFAPIAEFVADNMLWREVCLFLGVVWILLLYAVYPPTGGWNLILFTLAAFVTGRLLPQAAKDGDPTLVSLALVLTANFFKTRSQFVSGAVFVLATVFNVNLWLLCLPLALIDRKERFRSLWKSQFLRGAASGVAIFYVVLPSMVFGLLTQVGNLARYFQTLLTQPWERDRIFYIQNQSFWSFLGRILENDVFVISSALSILFLGLMAESLWHSRKSSGWNWDARGVWLAPLICLMLFLSPITHSNHLVMLLPVYLGVPHLLKSHYANFALGTTGIASLVYFHWFASVFGLQSKFLTSLVAFLTEGVILLISFLLVL